MNKLTIRPKKDRLNKDLWGLKSFSIIGTERSESVSGSDKKKPLSYYIDDL